MHGENQDPNDAEWHEEEEGFMEDTGNDEDGCSSEEETDSDGSGGGIRVRYGGPFDDDYKEGEIEEYPGDDAFSGQPLVRIGERPRPPVRKVAH